MEFFATAPKANEGLLADELRSFGALAVKETRAGVYFSGSLLLAYRVCLWSRVASRILLHLADFSAADENELYAGILTLPWSEHMRAQGTLAVSVTAINSPIANTHYAAQKVKDAVVDQFRDACGQRPSVDLISPDVRINVHLKGTKASVYLNLSGEGLHRRGYRTQAGPAPLKENLAAAILLWAKWPKIAAAGGGFIDPMCGSGTLCIEAALIATDTAPGLLRSKFGFESWLGHDQNGWQKLLLDARQRQDTGAYSTAKIIGFDCDPNAVAIAHDNVHRAGLSKLVHIEKRDVKVLAPLTQKSASNFGLIATNPPYGERMSSPSEVQSLYTILGGRLKTAFGGWSACILTADQILGRNLGLRASRIRLFYNGSMACRALYIEIPPKDFTPRATKPDLGGSKPHPRLEGPSDPTQAISEAVSPALGDSDESFANRLLKNFKHLQKWAKRKNISCYRVYDRDLPEYAVSIDLYDKEAVIQEYAPPKSIDRLRAATRLQNVINSVPRVLNIKPEAVVLKVKTRQRGSTQYSKLDKQQRLITVTEGDCKFLVNLKDYIDTGLFLDHRPTRRLLKELASGRRFLNLFAYTGTATVAAALGGAKSSVSVDMSNTYLNWAQKNLQLNGLNLNKHQLVSADCLAWLPEEHTRFDLIFLDPPTFSNSKKMPQEFDLQRDQTLLLKAALKVLAPQGILIFSNNFRKFSLNEELLEANILDVTKETLDEDFVRGPLPHRCWKITR